MSAATVCIYITTIMVALLLLNALQWITLA